MSSDSAKISIFFVLKPVSLQFFLFLTDLPPIQRHPEKIALAEYRARMKKIKFFSKKILEKLARLKK